MKENGGMVLVKLRNGHTDSLQSNAGSNVAEVSHVPANDALQVDGGL